uniref:G-protein coupled receptors family 1 profile domain-containing protein n=1 Tax=Serinus canaria TaxID=9135 RepID=A0A8C9UDD9_SERCA
VSPRVSRLPAGLCTPVWGSECRDTDSVTLLICLCGLAGNGAVLWLLGFHIRRNPITVYILNLAVADFTFLLFMVPSSLLYLLEDVSYFRVVSLKYMRSLLLLSLLSYNMGMYLLTAISIERCSSILFPLWYRCRRPQHLSWVVCALLWALSIAVMAVVTSLCLSDKPEHCRVSLISMHALTLAISMVFSLMMLVSNLFLFLKLRCGSRRRQPGKLFVAILLNVLLFFAFGIPFCVEVFLNLPDSGDLFPEDPSLFLALLNCSLNPVIYVLVGSCQRRRFQRSVRGGEALAQVVQRNCGCSICGGVQARLEQTGIVEGVPAHCRGWELDDL